MSGRDSQGNQVSFHARLSASGRFVVFSSMADNLVSNDTNGVQDVFVHDRLTGTTERVSVGPRGAQGNGGASGGEISANGRIVAFNSQASNLAPGDTNGVDDAFVHDRSTGITKRVSIGRGGAQANGFSSGAVLSADGRFVAFVSDATNLVRGDTNRQIDTFVYDRRIGNITRVSIGAGGQQANGGSRTNGRVSLSADGRLVAFNSGASNLVRGDAGGHLDVFIRGRPAK